MRLLRFVLILSASTGVMCAQQELGTVATQDATVSGSISVTNGRAILLGSSNVVAKDHTAEVALNRGGTVLICATSGLHLTQSPAAGTQPLMLALDRGAIEVKTMAVINDVVMTPDLRFAVRSASPIDLRLRVTKNGDTCVENKGASAPMLGITDQFGEASYELRPGQHVLFEHGNLKEVVDNESSPCGCPAATPAAGMSVADALLAPGSAASPQTAEAQHPFPAAVSQGLAAPPPTPQATPGTAHAQVATTLGFSGDGNGTISGTPAAGTPSTASTPTPTPPPPAPPPSGFGHRLGRFFKRLFGGG